MKVPRIYIHQPLEQGAVVELDERAARHAVRVLRLRPGQPLTVFNGEGNEWRATLARASTHEVSVEIAEPVRTERESALIVTLLQGISRRERMDYTLQKSVELGVMRISPVWTERSQVRLRGERLERRIHHWRGVIIHACEQSGRNTVPALDPPRDLDE